MNDGIIKYTLPKDMRLLTSKDYSDVFQNDSKFMFRTKIFKIQAVANSTVKPRLGMAIQKKQVKRAHDRNRIKRLIREVFRNLQNELKPIDFVFLINNYNNKLTNEAIISELTFIFTTVNKKINLS